MAAIAAFVSFLASSDVFEQATKKSRQSSLAAARIAVRNQDWERAAAAAAIVLAEQPNDSAALLIAGEASARLDRFVEAIGHYDAVPDSAGGDAALARLCAGDLRLKLGRMSEAERDFRSALRLDPDQKLAIRRLVVVLMLSGRRWEAGPYLLELVKRDEADLDVLCSLGDPARLVTNYDQLTRFREIAPEDPLPVLGLAAQAQLREENDQAELLLKSIVEEPPQLVEAQVRLGELLARQGGAGRFLAWHRQVPSEAEEHPQLWHIRGLFALEQDEGESAARCFWEALRREPNHLAASYQLGQTLVRLGRSEEAARIGERARQLQRVAVLVSQLHSQPKQIEVIREMFELLRDLGRPWEARAWLQAAMIVDPSAAWIAAERDFFVSTRHWESQQTTSAAAPESWLSCASYSLPEWATADTIAGSAKEASSDASGIRFERSAIGIDFTYFNSPDPSTPGVRMQEFTGGGVGVIDFDRDGRPDLYFPQGCEWPPDPEQRTYLDRLFRNRGSEFDDVTQLAGIMEPAFSQGVSCGDFDGDGFDDIYVANIGGNRLFRNHGDGTFSDITDSAGLNEGELAQAWTVSAAMADLNGDGLPDLFDVNYVQGERVYEMVCGEGDVQRACSPTSFEGQPDRLLLNRGDGTFANVTDAAGINGPNGTGLGIVIGDFDGSGRLDLFVANDIQNNHYYANLTSSPGSLPRFEEQALLNGLAYDRDGRAQACMGVAAGDADGDGLTDLFVTNYVDESNTLYLQRGAGLFVDASRTAGLTAPSFKKLGFGTQFLDADADGWEDLVVVNGHIDDFSHQGYEHRMEPQFFRNSGGKFEELSSASVGGYFLEKKLGRGLARLDWNGDGLEDFAVSHLEDPVALLTNRTVEPGNTLRVRLVASNTSRDATGARVTVTTKDRKLVRQLFAGDGYEASNEKLLTFGLSEEVAASEVQVRWPSGINQTLGALAQGEWLVIEGRARPLQLSAAEN